MPNVIDSGRFAQTQDDVELTVEWMDVDCGITADSLIIKNNDNAGILYFREAVGEEIIPIDPGETYETSLTTRSDFQLRGDNLNQDYKVIASVN